MILVRSGARPEAPLRARSQPGRDSRDPRWQIRQHLQGQTVLDAAEFDLNFSGLFFQVEAGGVGGVEGQVRSGSERGNRRRLEAQFVGAENVFDRNDEPLRFTPRKGGAGLK